MPIPKNIQKPVRQSAKHIALTQLQKWIIDGTLQPGEKINDHDLSEALGLSRTPIREALQILSQQGFVEMHPGKETKITAIDLQTATEVYPPLAALHETAVELAIDKITRTQIEELEKKNDAFATAIAEKDAYAALILDEQFHQTIIDITANTYITSFTNILHMHARRLEHIFFNLSVPAQTSIQEHKTMITALQHGDKQLAARTVKTNWLRPMENIIQADRKDV